MPAPFPFPHVELEFRKDGSPARPQQLDALLGVLAAPGGAITDLFVVSHGWNNDMDEARALYRELFTNVKAQAAGVPGVAGRRFAVVAVLWPSKKFADRDLIPGQAELEAGGAASVGGDDGEADAVVREQLDTLRLLLGEGLDEDERAALERAWKMVPFLDGAPDRQQEFAKIVLRFLPPGMGKRDEEQDPAITLADATADGGGESLLARLGSRPSLGDADGPAPEAGGATTFAGSDAVADPSGGAAGIGDFFGGIKSGAMRLLNYVTYYQMKDRAGDVGRRGVNEVLRTVRARFPNVRLHLVGHSFGGRVVTSAVAGGEGRSPAAVDSLSLLQAAFSHFSFSENYASAGEPPTPGFFRRVVSGGLVGGPVLVTHTRNDRAVGLAYAVASRAGGQIAAALGDAKDRFGGLGSNGAQATPEVDATLVALTAAGSPYAQPFRRGAVYNLKADPFVADHSDVRNEAVAYALLHAVAATGP